MVSEEVTYTTAFAVVPMGSAEKTLFLSAFSTLSTRITGGATAGAYSADVRDQLLSQMVDLAEAIASNMTDHQS